ncbi:hypothetical protein C2G38_2218181 [Gigaspora rosea]|uniref:Uncharacterized protein n=1 Tax=Gigaspora rosea TaxID=44941 RepID=A0A397UAA1_9GLOM|nr:hypothetical protein C2G38_2218181 [Gigaspora rosea]
MTKTFFLEFISNEINGLPNKKNDEEEEEEEIFEQDTESAKRNNSNKQETWINNHKTFKLDLKSTENGNFNKQDPTNNIIARITREKGILKIKLLDNSVI